MCTMALLSCEIKPDDHSDDQPVGNQLVETWTPGWLFHRGTRSVGGASNFGGTSHHDTAGTMKPPMTLVVVTDTYLMTIMLIYELWCIHSFRFSVCQRVLTSIAYPLKRALSSP